MPSTSEETVTTKQRIEYVFNGLFGVCLLLAVRYPALGWTLWSMIAVLAVYLVWTFATATPADHERGRRRAIWLIPLATAALAAQMVYFAEPEERVRALLLGAAMVLLGLALGYARRRAT
jgi:hypothetical protein